MAVCRPPVSVQITKCRHKKNLPLQVPLTEEIWMLRCLDLARMGIPKAFPNPLVGAVIVYEDRIIGEGYHTCYGQSHAEVNAILSVRSEDLSLLPLSTLYVSLEPCSHTGKTPPCADLIISKGIKRCVIACTDPYYEVAGRGIAKLREAGIDVITGPMEKQANELNSRFLTGIAHHRPYIILKWAQTANGYYAPADGSQRWITNEWARIVVHKWRSREQAILCGTETILADNPALNTRYWEGASPLRIILDRHHRLDPKYQVFDGTAPTLVITSSPDHFFENKWICPENEDLPELVSRLYQNNIGSLLVEGGKKLHDSLIYYHLWDEIRIITSATNWEEGIKVPTYTGLLAHRYSLDDNEVCIYKNPYL